MYRCHSAWKRIQMSVVSPQNVDLLRLGCTVDPTCVDVLNRPPTTPNTEIAIQYDFAVIHVYDAFRRCDPWHPRRSVLCHTWGRGVVNDNNGYNGMPREEWLNFPLRLRSMWRKMTTRAYRSCDGIMKLEPFEPQSSEKSMKVGPQESMQVGFVHSLST